MLNRKIWFIWTQLSGVRTRVVRPAPDADADAWTMHAYNDHACYLSGATGGRKSKIHRTAMTATVQLIFRNST